MLNVTAVYTRVRPCDRAVSGHPRLVSLLVVFTSPTACTHVFPRCTTEMENGNALRAPGFCLVLVGLFLLHCHSCSQSSSSVVKQPVNHRYQEYTNTWCVSQFLFNSDSSFDFLSHCQRDESTEDIRLSLIHI